MAGLHFVATLDNKDVIRKSQEIEANIKKTSKEIEKSGLGLEEYCAHLKRGLLGLSAALGAKEIIGNIIKIRGEFQQLEVAFKTMLRSSEKADALLQQLTKTAATTPFDLQSIANGAKQLLAYGTAADEVNETLIRLGNIAAGLSIPLGDLVYLYGTTMTQGRLYTQDLNQFTGRGIPMIRELANEFKVAESEIKGMVEAGKIGFPEVQKVINRLTNEGGMFYNLMQEQSKTLSGQISNLGDSISTMFNEIGQTSEGVINTAISGIAWLVENYEKVGKTILEIAAAYGAYKAALIVLSALEMTRYQMTLKYGAAEKALTTTQALRLAIMGKLVAIQGKYNDVLLKNPYALVTAAVVSLGYSIYKLASYQSEAEKAQKKFNDAIAVVENNIAKEQSLLNSLARRLKMAQRGTEEWKSVKDEIVKNYSDYLPGLEEEIEKTGILSSSYDKLSESIRKTVAVRGYENFQKKITRSDAEQAEDIEKVYNAFMATFENKDEAYKAYQVWLDFLYNGEHVPLQTQKLFSKIRTSWNGTANTVLFDIRRQNKRTEQELEKYKQMFDITDEDLSAYDKNGIIDGSSQIEEEKITLEDLVKEIIEAQKALNKLRLEANNGLIGEKEVEEANKNLDELTQSYNLRTGKTWGKGNKSTEKEEINARKKLSEELLKIRSKNEDDDISLLKEGNEKKLRQINKNYEDQKNAIEKKIIELEELNKKAGEINLNEAGLTVAQQTEIDRSFELANSLRKKATLDVYKSEEQAMWDYLKQYGTYQQKKLAITEEYADKIRNAQSEGEKKQLEAERNSALGQINVQDIIGNIDWSVVFGEFGGMFRDVLSPVLEEAHRYSMSSEFKSLDVTEQSEFFEALRQMEQALGQTTPVSFKQLGEEIDRLNKAMSELNTLRANEKQVLAELKDAQNAYRSALERGSEEEIASANEKLRTVRENADAISESVKRADKAVSDSRETVSKTSSALKLKFDNLEEGLQKLAAGGLRNAYDALIMLGKSVNGSASKLAKALESVPFLGAILGILDILKDGLSNLITSVIDSVLGAISRILNEVLSGDLAVSILESLSSGFISIFDAITFGGFSKWVGLGESDPHLEEDIESLTTSNEVLTNSIDKLTDELSKSGGSDALGRYKEIINLLNQQEANYKEIIKRSAAAHKSGIKGEHSSNYYIDENITAEQWAEINKILGTESGYYHEIEILNKKFGFTAGKVIDAASFWDLTSEEMSKIFRLAPELFGQIMAYADDGYKNAAQYMNDYIALADEKAAAELGRLEGLTQMSFDDLYNNFFDTLMDMSSSAEDFSNNFSEMLMRALLTAQLGDEFKQRLKEWQEMLANAMSDDKLSNEERDNLRKKWDEMVADAAQIRDEVSMATGYDNNVSGERSSASKAVAQASQESVDLLGGMMTNVQSHTYILSENSKNMNYVLSEMALDMRNINNNDKIIIAGLNSAISIFNTISSRNEESLMYLATINSRIGNIEVAVSKTSTLIGDIVNRGLRLYR